MESREIGGMASRSSELDSVEGSIAAMTITRGSNEEMKLVRNWM